MNQCAYDVSAMTKIFSLDLHVHADCRLDTIYSFTDQFILAYYRKTTTISSVDKITNRKKIWGKISFKNKETLNLYSGWWLIVKIVLNQTR
jgi:hypothetical protein